MRYRITSTAVVEVTDPAKLIEAARRYETRHHVAGDPDSPPVDVDDALTILANLEPLFYADGLEVEIEEGDFSLTALPETAHEKAEIEAQP